MTAQDFLERYNPEASVEGALSSAIKAAVQRNKFYIGEAPRRDVRDFWKEQLLELQVKYGQQRTVADYESDIVNLRANLRAQFPGVVGCRISHAQKSIGVFLKHLWCMGKIPTPPLCPVDAIILRFAGAVYPLTNWGYVDTLAEHQAKVVVLVAAKQQTAPNLSLAEWELGAFN
jgi:hypothetical protein